MQLPIDAVEEGGDTVATLHPRQPRKPPHHSGLERGHRPGRGTRKGERPLGDAGEVNDHAARRKGVGPDADVEAVVALLGVKGGERVVVCPMPRCDVAERFTDLLYSRRQGEIANHS